MVARDVDVIDQSSIRYNFCKLKIRSHKSFKSKFHDQLIPPKCGHSIPVKFKMAFELKYLI